VLSALLIGVGGVIASQYLDVFVALVLAMNVVGYFLQPATASLFVVNPLAGAGGLLNLFSTHPPMHERVRRLKAMRNVRWFAA
jgi:Zn-dependent protease with chaperone function